MRLNAYLLAGDPAWVEACMASYYGLVDRIVVSYDRTKTGWAGGPIPVDECLRRVEAFDRAKKVRLLASDYYRPAFSPMQNDTHQRQEALAAAGEGADWILALDNDEILPRAGAVFAKVLPKVPADCVAVSFPWRSFFQVSNQGRLLEVYGHWDGGETMPILFRPSAVLREARRTTGREWRVVVRAPWLDRLRGKKYPGDQAIPRRDALLHLSWIRSRAAILTKVQSWSHAHQFDGVRYVDDVWERARHDWAALRNFHPIWPKLWPRLRPGHVPEGLLRPAHVDAVALGVKA